MRPSLLDPLFAPLTSLSGVGPRQEQMFRRLLGCPDGAPRVIDLLFHIPVGAVDRSRHCLLSEAVPGEIATVTVRVDRHQPPPPGRSRAPHRVFAHDASGDLILTYFNLPRAQLQKLFPDGSERIVSGTVALWDGMRQMTHPDYVADPAASAGLPLIEPIYPLTEGLSGRQLGRVVAKTIARVPRLPEWLDEAWLQQRGWPDFKAALQGLHQPATPADVEPGAPAASRLAYDELLASQLTLALVRAQFRKPVGRSQRGDGRVVARVRGALPYALTRSQDEALDAIMADLAAPARMLRLLQGDVGSGKTIVALLAAAVVAEAGRQSALMAPTEILARQHHATIAPLAEAAGLSVGLLTGRERGRERGVLLQALQEKRLDLLVGTHALFQDEVAFGDLGLAIVDEQHRFGVHQRLALAAKGDGVDMLVLTATPIPRTLVLTYFGDMDVSQLREKPPGRQPIDTRAIALTRLEEVVDAVGRAVAEGQRAYWICPLVAESEVSDLAAATARFEMLKDRFGATVALVHGKMRSAEKDAAMARFASGDATLLVATTVVEVGVDVPQATLMVVEHAEQFGLSQLHQLRGRVGRGSDRSTCLLLYRPPLGEAARARLAVLRETEDGFRIAEEDLRLRGEGDVLGTRQSGTPGFRLARPEFHRDLLEAARDDARLILSRDPNLASDRGQALRVLLYLFERDDAIRLLRAG